MVLTDDLLTIPLEARFSYDANRNMFFFNMEGVTTRTPEDVQAVATELEKRLSAVGKKVQMVFNYDNFYLAPDLTDDYIAVIRGLVDRYYARVTRYTTSVFLRLKLSEQLSGRGLAPHIFESRQEATPWLNGLRKAHFVGRCRPGPCVPARRTSGIRRCHTRLTS